MPWLQWAAVDRVHTRTHCSSRLVRFCAEHSLSLLMHRWVHWRTCAPRSKLFLLFSSRSGPLSLPPWPSSLTNTRASVPAPRRSLVYTCSACRFWFYVIKWMRATSAYRYRTDPQGWQCYTAAVKDVLFFIHILQPQCKALYCQQMHSIRPTCIMYLVVGAALPPLAVSVT